METILDDTRYYEWFSESATLEGRTFRLVLLESPVGPLLDKEPDPTGGHPGPVIIDVLLHHKRRVVIEFENVRYLQVFDEFARWLDDDESREPHILARHSTSALKEWVKQYTILLEMCDEAAVTHYSVMATDNIYHVMTDKEPRVFEEKKPDPSGGVN